MSLRTLLVDNHDSYTYNLFQLIAEVNGAAPLVLTNDAAEWESLDLRSFDNVVVSPGPGHPGRERDFGRSREVIATYDGPILGVCLGHQGIGLAVGAPVVAAPAPRHGHLSRIRHTDDELFAGIPQGFVAVRYHSLCLAEPLPEGLTATAWAEDGVVMAVRRRGRPQWGVQFHPESVASEHGHRLLANFRDLTHPPRLRTGLDPGPVPRPRSASTEPARRFSVRSRRIDLEIDAGRLFAAVYNDSQHSFWLDRSLSEGGTARLSFMGDDRGPYAHTLTYRVGDGVVVARSHEETVREPGTIFDVLAERLAGVDVGPHDPPFGIVGGFVGYFGYEVKADCGAAAAHVSATPDAVWMFADRVVAVDHEQRCVYLVALVSDGSSADVDGAEQWFDDVENALRSRGLPLQSSAPTASSPVDVEAHLVRGRAQYLADVEYCQRMLVAGESYEICLTDTVELPRPADPLAFYRDMREHNPAPYGVFLRSADLVVAGSSPETFLSIGSDGRVRTRPIKGTAPRHADPGQDARAAKRLAYSAKTRAENLMIVDLLRNDLGRVCEIGSVAVPGFMEVESYATMHQLVSTVQGVLRADVSAVDCVRACFPGGSMTGAPKRRTMEILDAVEGSARGVYSGAIGYLGADSSAELSIVIRSAVMWGDAMRIGAGGAIVLASVPQDEFDEMLLKARAPLRGADVPAP